MQLSSQDGISLFTRAGYGRLLEIALASGYRFLAFDDPAHDTEPRVCLLRHDVDADPGAALELARIEADLGVHSTFFMMLRSPLYNILGRENSRLVSEIVSLGHRLGLHYDIAFLPGEHSGTDEWVQFERGVLAKSFDTDVSVVSYHQPRSSARPLLPGFNGMVLADSVQGYTFLADSNRAQRMSRLPEILRDASEPHLQLLVHPIWWATDQPDATTEQLWNEAFMRNIERSHEQLFTCEGAFGARRRFTID